MGLRFGSGECKKKLFAGFCRNCFRWLDMEVVWMFWKRRFCVQYVFDLVGWFVFFCVNTRLFWVQFYYIATSLKKYCVRVFSRKSDKLIIKINMVDTTDELIYYCFLMYYKHYQSLKFYQICRSARRLFFFTLSAFSKSSQSPLPPTISVNNCFTNWSHFKPIGSSNGMNQLCRNTFLLSHFLLETTV